MAGCHHIPSYYSQELRTTEANRALVSSTAVFLTDNPNASFLPLPDRNVWLFYRDACATKFSILESITLWGWLFFLVNWNIDRWETGKGKKKGTQRVMSTSFSPFGLFQKIGQEQVSTRERWWAQDWASLYWTGAHGRLAPGPAVLG